MKQWVLGVWYTWWVDGDDVGGGGRKGEVSQRVWARARVWAQPGQQVKGSVRRPPPPPKTAAQTISCACKGTFPFSSLRHVHVDNFGGAVSTFTRRLHFMEAVYTPFPPLPLKPPPQKIQEAVRISEAVPIDTQSLLTNHSQKSK